jgi:outer membrane protein assembly factor BamE (lipoprotein component of BamABCDE complex)
MKNTLLVVIFLGLLGCATVPSLGEKSTSLKVGMTKSEVTQVLGAPKTTSVKQLDDGVQEKWSYWTKTVIGFTVFDDPNLAGSGHRLTVTFKNDVLQSWGDQLDMSNIMENSTEAMKEMMKNMQPIQVEQRVYQGDSSAPQK